MKFIPIDYDQITQISKRDLAFIQQDKRLDEFVGRWASIENVEKTIEAKKKHDIDRNLLVTVLEKQYAALDTSDLTRQHISSLRSDNTFTIITAHQPSLFTGPLYYIYKIASVIKLTRVLTEAYPVYNFVPVFISGGEDHDFDEINHLHIYAKDVVWENNESGPVGRMSLDGIAEAASALGDILGNSEHASQIKSIIDEAIQHSTRYADVNFRIINTLFSSHGLVYINMDDPELKSRFIPVIKDELLNQTSFKKVQESIDALEDKGFKGQATPREINLFYFENGIRERIVFENEMYHVLNSDIKWTESELLAFVDNHPEKFSPNVLLRPLYQESILPNLAYVGGGGEIAYWTERATQFAHYNIPFPLLIRRNSVLQVSKGNQKQIGKTPFETHDFFPDEQSLINRYLNDFVSEDIDLSAYKESASKLFEEIAEKAKSIEEPLAKFILAEAAKQQKVFGHIESKLKKSLKSKNEVQLNKISSIQKKLFPQGGLQERYENFTMYYASQGQNWIDELVEHLNPLDRKFLIAMEE